MIECDVISIEKTDSLYRRQEVLARRHECATGGVGQLFLLRKTWPARMLGCRCVVFVGLCSGCGKWIVAR